jgi:hypothetical protein
MNAIRRSRPPRAIALTGALLTLTGALVLSLWSETGHAQAPAKKAPQPPAAAPATPSQAPQLVMPDAERIVLLVRTSLLTLNDALHTGNFTVLRDVAAPSFSQANSAARLASIFGNLAKQGVDLTAIAIIVPQLAEPPILDQQNKMLRIKGFFPGQPVRVDFDVIYQAVEGRWRLFGLSVQPTNVAAVAGAQPPAPTKTSDRQTKNAETEGAPAKK